MLHRLLRRPSPAMLVALVALFIALDGPATAARLIDGGSIRPNSITTTQIRNKTIRIADISSAAQKVLRTVPEKSVGSNQLRPNSVGTDKLLDTSVTGAKIANHGITSLDLADGSVGMTILADGAVTAPKLAPGSVGSDAVADGSLRVSDLGDFYGAVKVDFKAFAPNTCQVAPDIAPQPSSPAAGATIADDVVSVSPVAGWPDPIVVTANPGANNTLRIVACRVGGDPTDMTDTIDPPETTFHYVGFDQP